MYLTLSSSMSAFSNLRFWICSPWKGLFTWATRLGGDEVGSCITPPHTHFYHVPTSYLVRVVFLQQRFQLLQRHVDARPSFLLHQWLGDLRRGGISRQGRGPVTLCPSQPGRAPIPKSLGPRPCGSCLQSRLSCPGSWAQCPCCSIYALEG